MAIVFSNMVRRFETDEKGMCWGRITRVRLMDFCYECGKLGHVLEDCSSSSDTAEEQDCNSRFGTGVEDLSYEDWPGGVRKGGDEKYRELRIENRGGLGRLL
ncbi:hypothetical protein Csa_018306 [Cucumis sativus]|uniref:CCHC-type domain-containing protein n=1 Tax=Cucumis sativus TaxID=3659 RepID=A0A0A0KFU3_CUCSA|nr:hypothetical protein Csa_018306 [Cucumis sativus]